MTPGPGAVALLRAGWATGCLLAPRTVAQLFGLCPDDPHAPAVVRVLGGRDLAQSLLAGTASAPAVRAVGVWVDTVHALSMLGLAAASGRYRRAALSNAAVAAGWTALGRAGLRHPQPQREGWRRRAAEAVLPLLPGAPAVPAGPGRA